MPIYEFYCPHCHTIFNFFSRSINTGKTPACPRCDRPDMSRQISRFAISKNTPEKSGDDGDMPMDETKMEKAMEMLAGQADKINEDDPRQAVGLMRRLADMTGMQYGDNMEEALKRIEAGEDPEKVEADMGDLLDKDDMIVPGDKKGRSRRMAAPKRDETLYEM